MPWQNQTNMHKQQRNGNPFLESNILQSPLPSKKTRPGQKSRLWRQILFRSLATGEKRPRYRPRLPNTIRTVWVIDKEQRVSVDAKLLRGNIEPVGFLLNWLSKIFANTGFYKKVHRWAKKVHDSDWCLVKQRIFVTHRDQSQSKGKNTTTLSQLFTATTITIIFECYMSVTVC